MRDPCIIGIPALALLVGAAEFGLALCLFAAIDAAASKPTTARHGDAPTR